MVVEAVISEVTDGRVAIYTSGGSIYLSVCLSACLPACLCLSVYLSACLPVCLSLSPPAMYLAVTSSSSPCLAAMISSGLKQNQETRRLNPVRT